MVTIALASGVGNLRITSDNRVFYSEANPEYGALLAFEEKYTENNNIWFILSQGSASDWETAEALRWLTQESWRLDDVLRVDSLANYEVSLGGDQLTSEPLLDWLCKQETRCDLRANWPIDEAPLVNRLVSRTKDHFSVFLTVALSRDDTEAIAELTRQSRDLAKDFRQTFPKHKIIFTGGVPMMNAFSEASIKDSSLLFPVAFISMLSVCWLLLSSFRNTLLLLYLGTTTVAAAMGLAGHMGWTFNTASSVTGVLVFTIVIAAAMHLVVSYRNDLHIYTRAAASQNALRVNLTPLVLAATTTSLSLMALLSVDAPPLKELGALAAFGCVYGTLQTLLYATGVLERTTPERSKPIKTTRLSTALSDSRLQKRLLPLVGALSFAGMYGLTQVQINDDFIGYFNASFEFRRFADIASEQMSSPNHLEIDVLTQDTVFSKDYLATVRQIQQFLSEQELVTNTFSFDDILRQTSRIGSKPYSDYEGDDLRQLYLAYELGLGDGQSSTDYVAQDAASSRISILLGTSDSRSISSLIAAIREFASRLDSSFAVTVTGENAPVANLTLNNTKEMTAGIGFTVLLASVLVFFWKKSIRLSIICFLACVAPIMIGLGLWMLFVGEIGLAVVVVISVTIGIVIDDAIHLISRYTSFRENPSRTRQEATAKTIRTVGAAIATTTIAMGTGFAALSFSGFGINAALGFCTVLVLVVSLLIDLVAVPLALSS